MQNSLRDKIISALSSSEISMLEVCTSDTHATAGKRTKEGYYELGSRTDHAAIVNLFGEALVEAKARLSDSSFELSVAETRIRVMGVRQFEDYSRALDGSIKVTKAFLMVTAATFVAMLVFSY
jgi:putative membrane protein